MSRCFPFPPPGYERKLDATNLLKKEKRKEKKHKKGKKDREKREGKEEREEKKKAKEKTVDQQSQSQNGDSLLQNNEDNKQKNDSSGHKKSSMQPRNRELKELLIGKEEYVQSKGQNEKMLVNRISEEEKRTGSLQFPVDSRKSNVDRGEILKMDSQGINTKSTFNRTPMIQNMFTGKKTIERVKEKTEATKVEGDKNKFMKNGETIGYFYNLSTYSSTSSVGIQHSSSELKKRKDLETNVFSHESEPGPNKMARHTSNILTENGRKQDILQNLELNQPGKSTKADAKERKVNGSNKPLLVSSTKPSQLLLNSKKKESIRPPHPDTNYLKQILAVPELDQWSRLDNQEWLFSSKA